MLSFRLYSESQHRIKITTDEQGAVKMDGVRLQPGNSNIFY